MSDAPIVVEHLDHAFGEGELRRQILFDICAEVRSGEIVILTGPSGSGKTTLLTLMGALRSAQSGSLRVLGHELRGADEATLASTRTRIGYIFQSHNLLDSLSAGQNVQMPLLLDRKLRPAVRERRALQALESVGLGDRAGARPSQLSGGQRQRVAVARALVREPALVLADEPTASLDKAAGRSVIEALERLARQQGTTVVLVTHDPRILDVADRILALEDGRLSSLMNVVTQDTRQGLSLLLDEIRRGHLVERVKGLDEAGFRDLLERVTEETERLLGLVDVLQGETFEEMLDQVLRAFAARAEVRLSADRVTVYLLDESGAEVWACSECEHGNLRDLRLPTDRGLLGEVVRTGVPINVEDVERDLRYDEALEGHGRGTTRSLLAVPLEESDGRVFAVVAAARHDGRPPFARADEEALRELVRPLALVIESWWRMSCRCRTTGVGRVPECCGHESHASPAPAEG